MTRSSRVQVTPISLKPSTNSTAVSSIAERSSSDTGAFWTIRTARTLSSGTDDAFDLSQQRAYARNLGYLNLQGGSLDRHEDARDLWHIGLEVERMRAAFPEPTIASHKGRIFRSSFAVACSSKAGAASMKLRSIESTWWSGWSKSSPRSRTVSPGVNSAATSSSKAPSISPTASISDSRSIRAAAAECSVRRRRSSSSTLRPRFFPAWAFARDRQGDRRPGSHCRQFSW